MSENSKIEIYKVDPGGEVVSLHPIYCDCERCNPFWWHSKHGLSEEDRKHAGLPSAELEGFFESGESHE